MNPASLLRIAFLAPLLAIAAMSGSQNGRITQVASPMAGSQTRQSVVLESDTVPSVADGRAVRVGNVKSNATLVLTLGLPIHNQVGLDHFIATEALHGHYLTQGQFDTRFGAPAASVRRVLDWAKSQRMHVNYMSPDGFTITVSASASVVERAFKVHLSTYRFAHKSFFANDGGPVVPNILGLQTITGLNDMNRAAPTGLRRLNVPGGGYDPAQLRAAYGLAGQPYDGTGQTVGLTGFGPPVSDSDLAAFATATGDPKLSSCKSCTGPDKVQWVEIKGLQRGDNSEEALDVEYLHGLAPHSHLIYYLGGDGNEAPMETAMSRAANNKKIHIVSNSWSEPGVSQSSDPFLVQTSNTLKHAVAVGTTFYFSTGDNALDSGCVDVFSHCGLPAYPAVSQYDVAVGGTNLQMDSTFKNYLGETTWSLYPGDQTGSGGGCASFVKRPSWQNGVGAATCSGRAIPDISADADPSSGAEIFDGGGFAEYGGTSLSAPLISALAAVTDRYLKQNSLPRMGFAAPKLYTLGQSASASAYYHDVFCGSNGYPAGFGWDEATGFGSASWPAFARGFGNQPVDPLAPVKGWSCHPPSSTTRDLLAVTCTGSVRCHVVGANGAIANTMNGWNWSPPNSSSATTSILGVSCPSTNVCYALSSHGWVQKTSNGGKTWTASNAHLSNPAAISCPTPVICYVVGGQSIEKTTNGATYNPQSNPSTAALAGLSCPNAAHCFVVQTDGTILGTTDGSGWDIVNDTPAIPGTLASISCSSTIRCYAVGAATTPGSDGGTALVYTTVNGTDWTDQIVGTSGPLTGVSCASDTTCDAVGSLGDVIRTIDGSTWTAPIGVLQRDFSGVSCPAISVCFATAKAGAIIQLGASPGN